MNKLRPCGRLQSRGSRSELLCLQNFILRMAGSDTEGWRNRKEFSLFIKVLGTMKEGKCAVHMCSPHYHCLSHRSTLEPVTFAHGTVAPQNCYRCCISVINSCFQSAPLYRLRGNGTAIPEARERHTGQGWTFNESLHHILPDTWKCPRCIEQIEEIQYSLLSSTCDLHRSQLATPTSTP